jgi:two-component system sensor histidine kinase UhpB
LARLRPAGLEELGLIAALRALAEFWRSRHPELVISVEAPDALGFGAATDDVIYRIVRESFGNAVRHGQPNRVDIEISTDLAGTILVNIRDDGGGFPPDSEPRGFGLQGMADRVASLGGILSVSNRADAAGVIVAARFPPAFVAEPTDLGVPA